MASRSVLRSTLVLNSRAHLLLRHKPSLSSNPLFQHSSLETLTTTSSSSSSFTISNHNFFFSPSRSFYSCFQPSKYVYPMEIGKGVKLYSSSSAITQGGGGGDSTTVKRKPGRPRKIRPDDDETVSLESSTPPSVSSQKRGRGRPPGSGNKKKKEVEELELSPVSSPQTQKRGRGRPPGSGNKKKKEVEELELFLGRRVLLPRSGKKKEQFLTGQEHEELWLKNWREEQKLKEQAKFVGQEQGKQQGLKRGHSVCLDRVFECPPMLDEWNNRHMETPYEVFLKVKNKRDLPDIDHMEFFRASF